MAFLEKWLQQAANRATKQDLDLQKSQMRHPAGE